MPVLSSRFSKLLSTDVAVLYAWNVYVSNCGLNTSARQLSILNSAENSRALTDDEIKLHASFKSTNERCMKEIADFRESLRNEMNSRKP